MSVPFECCIWFLTGKIILEALIFALPCIFNWKTSFSYLFGSFVNALFIYNQMYVITKVIISNQIFEKKGKNLNFSIIFTLINWNICNIYNTPNLFSSPRMSAFGKVKKLSKMFILIGKHNIWIIYINFRCFIKSWNISFDGAFRFNAIPDVLGPKQGS